MTKAKKPPAMIICAGCRKEVEKKVACAWTGPSGRAYVCQDCASKALGLR